MGQNIVKIGRVLSNKMDKTAIVEVEIRRRSPVYKRVVTVKAKFTAHDPGNACQVHDIVKIAETRPLSKTKRWRVVEIISTEGIPAAKQEQENDSKVHQE